MDWTSPKSSFYIKGILMPKYIFWIGSSLFWWLKYFVSHYSSFTAAHYCYHRLVDEFCFYGHKFFRTWDIQKYAFRNNQIRPTFNGMLLSISSFFYDERFARSFSILSENKEFDGLIEVDSCHLEKRPLICHLGLQLFVFVDLKVEFTVKDSFSRIIN